ncbi:MAG: flavodoxin domain-containing protein [Anaerolineae bacterium]|nr:flavodoxin domain-containing protein [Anaerolineae bacterium]
MKVLVTVASKYGATRGIAEAIAEELTAEHLSVEVKLADEVKSLIGFDAVVLGSAIYAGSWLPEARTFVFKQHEALALMPIWAFSSGPLGDSPAPMDEAGRLIAPLSDLNVRDHQVFVGMLNMANLSIPERLVAKAVHAPQGDFRDWEEIRDWARTIARTLRAELEFDHA